MQSDDEFQKTQIEFNEKAAKAAVISAYSAVAGIVLGLVGIAIALYSLSLTNRLERIKIQPAIEFYFGDIDSTALLSIKNYGFGPAKITGMLFKHEEKQYEAVDRDRNDDWGNKVISVLGLSEIYGKSPEEEKFSVRIPIKDTIIGSNEELKLLVYRGFSDGYRKVRPEVQKAFNTYFYTGGNVFVTFCAVDGGDCRTVSALQQ
ncbi:MAG: hypothetical protein ROO70_19040 [Labrenzia sp.]